MLVGKGLEMRNVSRMGMGGGSHTSGFCTASTQNHGDALHTHVKQEAEAGTEGREKMEYREEQTNPNVL